MEIKPETVKKVAYPALAAVMAAAAFSSCDRQPQRIVGKVPAADSREKEIQRTGGLEPQRLGGDEPAPAKQLPDTPTPPEDIDQGIPGEPPEVSVKR